MLMVRNCKVHMPSPTKPPKPSVLDARATLLLMLLVGMLLTGWRQATGTNPEGKRLQLY